MIYITGDKHAKFAPVAAFCDTHETTVDDTLIILGDAGINFHGEAKDRLKKNALRKLPITLFCLHGNHDMRPATIPGYREIPYRGGTVYREDGCDNLLFAKDGSIFDFDGLSTLVIGGAYSLDKDFRIALKWPWFEDEQPSDSVKKRVEETLAAHNHQVDVVLSHTAPLSHLPFSEKPRRFSALDVDVTTETWLAELEQKLNYRHWYCGHFHVDRHIGRFTFMLDDFLPYGHFRE